MLLCENVSPSYNHPIGVLFLSSYVSNIFLFFFWWWKTVLLPAYRSKTGIENCWFDILHSVTSFCCYQTKLYFVYMYYTLDKEHNTLFMYLFLHLHTIYTYTYKQFIFDCRSSPFDCFIIHYIILLYLIGTEMRVKRRKP